MKRYLRVYRTLLRLNLESVIVYPANFYNSLLASVAWGFFSMYSIVLLTHRTTGAFGWTREQLLLLNGVYGIIIGMFHVVFSRNFSRFAGVIHSGQLDSVLVKPIDAQFLLSFWLFGWVNLSRVIISAGYVAIVLGTLGVEVAMVDVLWFLILGFFATLLLYSLWFIVITLTIWFTRLSNLVELMFNITGIARYPRNMFTQAAGVGAWVLLPLLLIINIPTRVYLHNLHIGEILLLFFLAFGVFIISRKFWIFALSHYSSASS